MNAPGKGLLKVTSILFIIFGAISTIVSLLAVIGSAALTAMASEVGAGALGGILIVATIIMLISSVLMLIIGIIGVGKCGDPSKAGFFIVTGIILCALSLISLIIGTANGDFQFTGLIGFVLPILYIVGGSMNKKVVAVQQ